MTATWQGENAADLTLACQIGGPVADLSHAAHDILEREG